MFGIRSLVQGICQVQFASLGVFRHGTTSRGLTSIEKLLGIFQTCSGINDVMLQLDSLRGAPTTDYGNQPVNGTTASLGDQASGDKLQTFPSLPAVPIVRPSTISQGNGLGTMLPWSSSFASSQQQEQQIQQQQQLKSQQQTSGATHNSDEDDDDYRPFTPPPPRERLSYTRYQLELLNGIYLEVRYPNSTQKQLIAKRVGITREQVKIWFQNRRRKDVVTKSGNGKPDDKTTDTNSAVSPTPSSGNENSNPPPESNACVTELNPAQRVSSDSNAGSQNPPPSSSILGSTTSDSASTESQFNMVMVSPVVLRSIIAELNKFDNEYLKLKKSKKKKNKSKAARLKASMAASLPTPASQPGIGVLPSCKSQRLFQSYDMVAPPNKITPTAFLNTSANRFKHADGTSAFQTPREFRSLPGVSATDSRLWDGFGSLAQQHPTSTLPVNLDSSDLLHSQRSPAAADLAHASLASSFNLPSPSAHQTALGNYLAGMGSTSSAQPTQPVYENLPVLSDLLSSYKNHASSTAAMAAAAAAQRQFVEQSYLSSSHPSLHHSQQPILSASIQQDQNPLFHIQTGSTGSSIGSGSNSSINSSLDGGKSPLDSGSSLSSPSPHNPFSIHSHHQASHFALNRVFPFPLIADPPMVLSNIRQNDSFRQHTQWPSGPSSPLRSPAQSVAGSALIPPFQVNHTSSGLVNDPYRPLMISSLSNPYFCPQPVSSSSLPPAPPLWSSQPPSSHSTNQQTYSNMYSKPDV